MKTRLALLAAAGFAAACATVPQSGSMMSDCDRACLAESLDIYLDAVFDGDPSQAPLFEAYRHTENSVVQPLGEGVWREITGVRSLDRRYYDAETGNAVFMGTVTHAGAPSIVSVRIKVQSGKVTEAEWHLAHASDAGIEGEPGGTLFDIDEIEANPPPQRAVPVTERASREVLAAVANSYFDGITNADRRLAMANPGCSRWENGLKVTGRPLAEDRIWDGHEGLSDCRSGQGNFNVENVAARRIPVIDEEAQIVIASAVFIREEDHPKWRNHFSDVIVMDGGRITGLYATMFYVPASRAVPNWPPYEGNFAR
jgi:hypothetical protein